MPRALGLHAVIPIGGEPLGHRQGRHHLGPVAIGRLARDRHVGPHEIAGAVGDELEQFLERAPARELEGKRRERPLPPEDASALVLESALLVDVVGERRPPPGGEASGRDGATVERRSCMVLL